MTHNGVQVALLKAQLQKLGADFICATPLPATSTSVMFLGPFQGKVVVWNMALSTLEHLKKIAAEMTETSRDPLPRQSFIEIAAGKDDVFPLQIVLDVAAIDEAVIKKSIIMMRNYKRLAVGRIDFGNVGIKEIKTEQG